MIPLLLGIVLFVLVMANDVTTDYRKWKHNVSVNHFKESVNRGLLLIPSFLCLFFPVDNLLPWAVLAKFYVTAMMMQAWYWEFFDGWYNKKRGFSWRFTGSDDKDDAKLDNLLQKLTPFEIGFLKWSLIVLFTTLYLLF